MQSQGLVYNEQQRGEKNHTTRQCGRPNANPFMYEKLVVNFSFVAGSKPLMALAKKAPNFNKKEEIFMTLTEHQVSMARAAWFIKLSSAYTVAVSEAKIKKRQSPDPTTGYLT